MGDVGLDGAAKASSDDEDYLEVLSEEDLKAVQPGGSTETLSDLDLSYRELEFVPAHYFTPKTGYHPRGIRSISLHHNRLNRIIQNLSVFSRVVALDLSNNGLSEVPVSICRLQRLRVLLLKSNALDRDSFPKAFEQLQTLEVLNLSGNSLEELPEPLLGLSTLKALYVGSNRVRELSYRICNLKALEVLYMGGNRLRDVPATIGKLSCLTSLVLCDNRIESIPSTVADLERLESLSLHNNQIKTLPTELVRLQNLQQLSLRSNPLVARFVRDMTLDPPSLMELAGRVVRMEEQDYTGIIPRTLQQYLDTAHHCVNPKCKGVYFEARVEHVKFVDFCGKYRVPLLQYLCSTRCSVAPMYAVTDTSESEAEFEDPPASKMKKVLLG